jgi:hypothetical protein
MQDEEDEQMVCLRNFFCIYHNMSSKDEDILVFISLLSLLLALAELF